MEGPTFTGREGKGPNSKGDGMEERGQMDGKEGKGIPPPSQDE